MTSVGCVLPHHHNPDRPRSALDGLLICIGCLSHLEQAVAEMPAHYDQLARRLAPGKGHGPHVSGSRERALPIDPTVADHRTDMQAKLTSWAVMVAEERGIGTPRSSAVTVVAPWLLVHLRWCCAQPWVDEYAAELRSLRSRSFSLLYPSGRRRVEVGLCIEEGCEGGLSATVTRADDLLPSAITCSARPEEHFWPAADWHTLGRRLHGAAGYDTRAALAFTSMLDIRGT